MEITSPQSPSSSAKESAITSERRRSVELDSIFDLRRPAVSPAIIMAMLESESMDAEERGASVNDRAMIELKKLHFKRYFEYSEIKSIYEKEEKIKDSHKTSEEKESEFIGKMQEMFQKRLGDAKGDDIYRIQSHKVYFEKMMAEVGSWRDKLTGLYTRQGLQNILKLITTRPELMFKEMGNTNNLSPESKKIQDTGAAVLLLDLDKFKKINDDYGHIEGDKALVDFAKALTDENVLRKTDIVARLGGDEFLIIAFNTDPKEIHEVNEKINERIKKVTIGKGNDELRFSMGSDPNKTWSDLKNFSISGDLKPLIAIADKAVYELKNGDGKRLTNDPG